jgi:2,4-dienoyl-CoA reductase-like NADH-dependent reductase (Old Yellow Enzyme family)
MEDLEQIKRAVSSKPMIEPIGVEPLPHEIIDLDRMIEETPKIAPVFVRIDKYKEILGSINELKATIANLEAVLNIRRQIHGINANSDDMLEKALHNFNEATNNFSREFSIPRGMKYLVKEPKNADEFVDNGVIEIGRELERLKAELEKIEV